MAFARRSPFSIVSALLGLVLILAGIFQIGLTHIESQRTYSARAVATNQAATAVKHSPFRGCKDTPSNCVWKNGRSGHLFSD